MKKLKYLCSAVLVASLLAIPATAQKVPMGRMGQIGHHHNNDPRKDTDKAEQNPDRDKAKGGKAKATGETQGKHKGHR